MSIAYRMSIGGKVIAANMALNAGAKPFVPGQLWMKPRRVQWHTVGVTNVRYYNFKDGAEARQKGCCSELRGSPASGIKKANPKEAQPFLVPSVPLAQLMQSLPHNPKYPMVTCEEPASIQDLRDHLDDTSPEESDNPCKLYRTQPDRFNYCDN